MSTLDMHSEVGQGAEGIGGSQQQHQSATVSLRLLAESGIPVSSHTISGTSILWRSSTVKTPGLAKAPVEPA